MHQRFPRPLAGFKGPTFRGSLLTFWRFTNLIIIIIIIKDGRRRGRDEKGEEVKEIGDRPPSIFGLEVALGGLVDVGLLDDPTVCCRHGF